MIAEGRVGPATLSDGAVRELRLGRAGALITTQAHGIYHEAASRNRLFMFGLSNTAMVAANAIATGLGATAQPVIGIWNPSTSGVNLSIIKATVVVTTVANSAVSPGGFMWVGSVGNTAISTGSTPINCTTLASSGSSSKVFAMSTALTGLSNNLAVLRASDIAPPNAAGAATAVSLLQGVGSEWVDGSLICPPGGVVAIMGQVSTTTISLSVGLVWEEFVV